MEIKFTRLAVKTKSDLDRTNCDAVVKRETAGVMAIIRVVVGATICGGKWMTSWILDYKPWFGEVSTSYLVHFKLKNFY